MGMSGRRRGGMAGRAALLVAILAWSAAWAQDPAAATPPPAASGVVERAQAMFEGRRWRQAMALLEEASRKGDAGAQMMLCRILQSSVLVSDVESDDQRAAFWCRHAAQQGDAEARYNIGRMYAKGIGVAVDLVQARHWLEEAGLDGHIGASLELCKILGYGEVRYDERVVLGWCMRAARGGSGVAQWLMGQKFEDAGRRDMAYGWYLVADESGNSLARRRLEEVHGFEEFSDAEMAEGREIAQAIRDGIAAGGGGREAE